MTILVENLALTLRALPVVIIFATMFRSVLLLSGKKRSFATWTRNRFLSLFTILTAPGMVLIIAIRYLISAIFGVELERVGVDTTFGEFTPYIVVRRTPRVIVATLALFLTTLIASYIGLLFLILPALYPLELIPAILCWYMAFSILANNAIRGGDVILLRSSLQEYPRSGVAELVIFVVLIFIVYVRVVGVAV